MYIYFLLCQIDILAVSSCFNIMAFSLHCHIIIILKHLLLMYALGRWVIWDQACKGSKISHLIYVYMLHWWYSY
jgi:hypothetical protein